MIEIPEWVFITLLVFSAIGIVLLMAIVIGVVGGGDDIDHH